MCFFWLPTFHTDFKQGTQAVMELISKNRAAGYAHSVHYTALFLNQAGYYNSLIYCKHWIYLVGELMHTVSHLANQPLPQKNMKFHRTLYVLWRRHQVMYNTHNTVSHEVSKVLALPIPKFLVGVLTEMNIISASIIAWVISVEKKRFLPRTCCTTSNKPGYNKKMVLRL